MLRYVKRMRLLWCAATLIPFGVAFFLNWLFGSPGGWQISSQIKMFFLFLQIGFVTAFFCSRHLYRAAASLWTTILLLWVLSLVVPYLATQTNHILDMADTTFEMSTPLYLFLSCLTAAWLLPGRGRMVMRVLCLVVIFFYSFIQFTYIGYYMVAHSLLSINMLLALAQTNVSEAMEYVRVNIPWAGLAAAVAALFCLGWFLFRMSRLSFIRQRRMPLAERIIVLVLFLANCGIAWWSASGTQLAHVVYAAKETLESFSEYQKILENRKHMRISDPETLAELRAVPDGVYVLVIGESLNRDHMNVYGYPRKTTPFQTEASRDDHYTFFDKVYACYTQTVQVLTYALTEKNQYNDIALAEAYSIIDMARAAGFKTTWISNQSRYGVWDTPIGAIGSTCDTQYWVNEYIGTNVITKDYDEALIPYLQKVDPENRRQLIVIHLMGSHVSYWDRYPGSFYHYPIDTSRERTTAEIMTDEYDNSVLYNDFVLQGIMTTAVNQLRADGVMYFSDHAEQVTERPGHNADMFDFTMVHIPFWVYTSDNYWYNHPENMEWIKNRVHTPFTNDMLYDTFLGFMGIRAAHYDPHADLFSIGYNKMPEQLMTMYGNIWVSKDVEGLTRGREALTELRFAEDDRGGDPSPGYPEALPGGVAPGTEPAWAEKASYEAPVPAVTEERAADMKDQAAPMPEAVPDPASAPEKEPEDGEKTGTDRLTDDEPDAAPEERNNADWRKLPPEETVPAAPAETRPAA